MTGDPFGTEQLRAGVLAAWRASPTRLREDANAESDLALIGYADRLLVELAQNAADAAQRSGSPGALRMTMAGSEIRVANTGAPLDQAGVVALAALRASAKRDEATVGRFGVGFAAVLSVSREPRVASRSGGVRFSAARTAETIAADDVLRGAAADLAGEPPALRLIWPTDPDEPPPPEGFDTEVRLPLASGVDGARVLADAAEQAPDLLLALPWLERIEIGDRVVHRTGEDPVLITDGAVSTRWRLVRAEGRLDDETVAALGPEARSGWVVTWALPVDDSDVPLPLSGDVLHVPTRTAERLTLPARLIATVPVEPSRRHVRPGAATDTVLAAAAACYPRLGAAVAPEVRTKLVPARGFPGGEIDAALRTDVVDRLRETAWLPSAAGPDVAPAEAAVLEGGTPELVDLLAELIPGLLRAELGGPGHAGALTALDVRRLGPADAVGVLAGLERAPDWWHRCYDAFAVLAEAGPAGREELGALPVPLIDGRTVTGPRGVLLAGDLPAPDVPGLRLVHPDAQHPLLERLGARTVDAAELLDALREAIERSVDDAEDGVDVEPLATAVLTVAGRLDEPVHRRPWLGALALFDEDGDPRRADELLFPGAALDPLLDDEAPFGTVDPELAQAFPRASLLAVGVLDGFAMVEDEAPGGPDHDLSEEDSWWEAIDADSDPPTRLLAVRDLDLVAEEAWPAALELLAERPETVEALREPRGYTAWWLSRYARLGGFPPTHWALPGDDLGGLYDGVPDAIALPDWFLAAIGVRDSVVPADAEQAVDLLARLADPARKPTAGALVDAYRELATAVVDGRVDPADVDPPHRLRVMSGEVVPAGDVLVLDLPWLAPVLTADRLVHGGDPAALADLLDVRLASEEVRADLRDREGDRVGWAELPEVVLACESAGLAVPPGTFVRHERLRVRWDGADHDVPCWVDPDGVVHATDPVRALLLTRRG